jgi:hypothetical protein
MPRVQGRWPWTCRQPLQFHARPCLHTPYSTAVRRLQRSNVSPRRRPFGESPVQGRVADGANTTSKFTILSLPGMVIPKKPGTSLSTRRALRDVFCVSTKSETNSPQFARGPGRECRAPGYTRRRVIRPSRDLQASQEDIHQPRITASECQRI